MKPMSLRLVTKALRDNGCTKVSDDGRHTKWACPCGKHTTPVPRHKQISPGTVGSIERLMACLPKGWLQ